MGMNSLDPKTVHRMTVLEEVEHHRPNLQREHEQVLEEGRHPMNPSLPWPGLLM